MGQVIVGIASGLILALFGEYLVQLRSRRHELERVALTLRAKSSWAIEALRELRNAQNEAEAEERWHRYNEMRLLVGQVRHLARPPLPGGRKLREHASELLARLIAAYDIERSHRPLRQAEVDGISTCLANITSAVVGHWADISDRTHRYVREGLPEDAPMQ